MKCIAHRKEFLRAAEDSAFFPRKRDETQSPSRIGVAVPPGSGAESLLTAALSTPRLLHLGSSTLTAVFPPVACKVSTMWQVLHRLPQTFHRISYISNAIFIFYTDPVEPYNVVELNKCGKPHYFSSL